MQGVQQGAVQEPGMQERSPQVRGDFPERARLRQLQAQRNDVRRIAALRVPRRGYERPR